MIEKLKCRYFGELEVGSVEDLPDGKVKLNFVNRPPYAPATEVMSQEEWGAGMTDKAVTKAVERREWFVKRMKPLHVALLQVLQKYNPRYFDTPSILVRMQDGLSEAYRMAVSAAFGVNSFEDDVSLDDIMKKIEDSGDKSSSENLSDFEKDVIKLIRGYGKKVHELKDDAWASKITQAMRDDLDQSVRIALGRADIYLRTDDIEGWLEKSAEMRANAEQVESENIERDRSPHADPIESTEAQPSVPTDTEPTQEAPAGQASPEEVGKEESA